MISFCCGWGDSLGMFLFLKMDSLSLCFPLDSERKSRSCVVGVESL